MRPAIVTIALVAAMLLVVYGCAKTQTTEPDRPSLPIIPSSKEETYFHIAWGIPLYWTLNYERGIYIIEAPDVGFYLEGKFEKDEYNYVMLDGTGCDGIIAPYFLDKRGASMYATSADFCQRHFYLVGLWTRSERPKSVISKQDIRPWRNLLKP